MCGIFGTINRTRKRLDTGLIRALTLANRERGKESLGFFDSHENMLKSGDDPIDVLATKECREWLDRTEQQQAWFVCGHTRYSTRGSVCDKNSHPFRYGKIIGSHNGIVSAPNEYTVDSEYLIDLLDKHDSDYQKALEDDWGYWTLGWYDTARKEFYVCVHDNTCGIAEHRGAWYFSSDPDHLMSALGCNEVMKLESGSVVKFTSDGNMQWCKKFTSKHTHGYKRDYRTTGGASNYSGYNYSGSSTSTGGSSAVSRTVTVNDPEKFIKDYDEEFRTAWQDYVHQYASIE